MILEDSTPPGKVTRLQFQHHKRFFRNLILTTDTIANRGGKAKAGVVLPATQQHYRISPLPPRFTTLNQTLRDWHTGAVTLSET